VRRASEVGARLHPLNRNRNRKLTLRRRALVAGFVSIALLTLTGCTALDHVSAQGPASRPEFVYCDASGSPVNEKANRIKVYAWADKGKAPLILAWEITTNSSPLRPGEELTYGAPPVGWRTLRGPVDVAGQSLSFQVSFERGNSSLDGVFDGKDLLSDNWLRWDGSQSGSACD
jgi:hypothetical protein